jgi:hypothetical protein
MFQLVKRQFRPTAKPACRQPASKAHLAVGALEARSVPMSLSARPVAPVSSFSGCLPAALRTYL